MIVLFTDFGLEGPYTGQVKAVLHGLAPDIPTIDLLADAPSFDPRHSAYLLAAYREAFPADAVFLCVIDPGVGSEEREPAAVRADQQWFVGPDNGLFHVTARRAGAARRWRIDWRPKRLSTSFHGRDLFAPVAAQLARGNRPAMSPKPWDDRELARWSDDLAEVIYVDRYGNLITGLRASGVSRTAALLAKGTRIARAHTFADAAPGQAFWYENSNGLVEIAVNRGSAGNVLGLGIGDRVAVTP